MEKQDFFNPKEYKQLFTLYKKLLQLSGDTLQKDDCKHLKKQHKKVKSEGNNPRNA